MAPIGSERAYTWPGRSTGVFTVFPDGFACARRVGRWSERPPRSLPGPSSRPPGRTTQATALSESVGGVPACATRRRLGTGQHSQGGIVLAIPPERPVRADERRVRVVAPEQPDVLDRRAVTIRPRRRCQLVVVLSPTLQRTVGLPGANVLVEDSEPRHAGQGWPAYGGQDLHGGQCAPSTATAPRAAQWTLPSSCAKQSDDKPTAALFTFVTGVPFLVTGE